MEFETEMEREDSRDYYVPEKSTFVTVVGIIFCVLAVLSLLGIVAQVVLFSVMNTNAEAYNDIQEQINEGQIPSIIGIFYTHRSIFMTLALAFALAQLVSSIGLLQRKNWARVMFIVIMSFSLIKSILGFSIQFFIIPNNITQEMQSSNPMANNIMMFARIFSFIIMALFCALYAWIIIKLSSEKIRREFDPKLQGEYY